ncbi:hypothetical protein AB0425_29510 [Actinosynnema sp. NPDC051121]
MKVDRVIITDSYRDIRLSDATAAEDHMIDDAPDLPDPEPEEAEGPAAPKRRLFGLSYHWVGAIAAIVTAVATLVSVLPAVLPTRAATDEAGRTVTQTVARTVTETDTVQATPGAPADVTTSGAPSATGGPTTSANAPATTPRPPGGTPVTTNTAVPRAETPARQGDHAVRFQGELAFGDFDLDYQQPRNLPEHNVYRIQESRLYADDPILLVEWPSDSIPGYADCAAKVSADGKSDATGLVAHSEVCGRTPDGRVFRIEVLDVSLNVIRAQVTVWEL